MATRRVMAGGGEPKLRLRSILSAVDKHAGAVRRHRKAAGKKAQWEGPIAA